MQRKHFMALASAIKEIVNDKQRAEACDKVARVCFKFAPDTFDTIRFYKACNAIREGEDDIKSLPFIMAWEDGETTAEEEIAGFQHLIDSGIVWQLQGCYGRTALDLIANGDCIDTHHVIS